MNAPQNIDSRTADALWARYARNRDDRTREQIIHQFERLAYSIANRFVKPGRSSEDLFQVALLGLVKAVDRFDPSTGHRFTTFAMPTISGEVRRYLRDHTWNVHVPRGTQELVQRVNKVSREVGEADGRTATAQEIAERVGASEEAVEDALSLTHRNHVLSLDGEFPVGNSGSAAVLEETLGVDDRELQAAEARISSDQLLQGLPQQLQELIRLRYLDELSQREVGRRLGMSQMRVSRMEQRALTQLRRSLVPTHGMAA